MLLSHKDKLARVVANYPMLRGVGQGWAACKSGQALVCFLPVMLVVAADGLVEEQEDKSVGASAGGSWLAHWSS